jgi:hypothetical protein
LDPLIKSQQLLLRPSRSALRVRIRAGGLSSRDALVVKSEAGREDGAWLPRRAGNLRAGCTRPVTEHHQWKRRTFGPSRVSNLDGGSVASGTRIAIRETGSNPSRAPRLAIKRA